MSQMTPGGRRDFYRGAGRRWEMLGWQFRSYFTPSHFLTYCRVTRNHPLIAADAARSLVCFDFANVEIDMETGRYVFILARGFEAAGCLPCFRKHFRFLATMRHKRHKRLLLDRPFRVYARGRDLPIAAVVATVTDHDHPVPAAGRHIRLRYDYRWPQTEDEIGMPYFAFPEVYDQMISAPQREPAAARPWRVFFAGCCEKPRYSSPVLPKRFGKMSRVQIIETLHTRLPPNRIRRLLSDADLGQPHDSSPQFVWAGSFERGGYRVAHERWIGALDRAEFFLACPGVEMPLCHNLVEAMARGLVPILEHPEYLDPPLEQNVNCLAFRGPDELASTMENAFQMPSEEIHRLRREASAYYEKHLAPGAFPRRLLSLPSGRIDVLLNACRSPLRATNA